MSRVEFLTNGQPIRQLGSPRYAELGGLQNLVFRAMVSFDDIPDFAHKMPAHSAQDFHSVTLCIYEELAFKDRLATLEGATLRMRANGPGQTECLAFIPAGPSFFTFCTANNRQLLARLGFEKDQAGLWPDTGQGHESIRHTRASRINVSVVA